MPVTIYGYTPDQILSAIDFAKVRGWEPDVPETVDSTCIEMCKSCGGRLGHNDNGRCDECAEALIDAATGEGRR